MYDLTVSSVFPALFAFYLGSWCDLFGRKFIQYMYLAALVVSQAFVTLNAHFMEWPKEWLLLATLIPSLVGEYVSFIV